MSGPAPGMLRRVVARFEAKGARAMGAVPCPDGRHDLIFDGEPQPVEAWWRCPKCGAEV